MRAIDEKLMKYAVCGNGALHNSSESEQKSVVNISLGAMAIFSAVRGLESIK